MIAARFAKSLKNQDWATVLVEILVVVLGVYIGIYIGEAQEEREIQREVNRSLVVLLDQMKADLVQLDEVIAAQEGKLGQYSDVLETLEADESDLNQLGARLLSALASNRTFYPNESAYQSMRELGYLAQVHDSALVMSITIYFESILERHRVNADSIDEHQGMVADRSRDPYWDRRRNRFLGDEAYAKARMWNGFRSLHGTAVYYISITRDLVRPQLVSSIAAIEAYLGDQE